MNWLKAPIVDMGTAQLFIKRLHANKVMFHFDDNPHDIEWDVTSEDADLMGQRVNEIYELKLDWGEFVCPIGYCLHVMEG